MSDLARVPWRTGSKAGRTIYAMTDGRSGVLPDGSPEGCDDPAKLADVLIGVMDTADLANEVVESHNTWGWGQSND